MIRLLRPARAAALLALAVLLVVPAARADAAGTVTATPSRGLVNNRQVTVSGGGFTPNIQLVVNQCAAEVTSSAQCGTAPLLLQGNLGGTYSTPFTVQRNLVTNGIGTIDCATAVNRCAIVVIELNNPATGVGTGLGFATIAASPARGLVSNRQITVSGGGYTPNTQLVVNQCASEATSSAGCSTTPVQLNGNAAGTYSTPFTVQRNLVTNGIGTINCATAVNRCGMVVTELDNLSTVVATGLGFGTIEASPATDLQNYDTVNVSGGGFPANIEVEARQCIDGENPPVCTEWVSTTTTDATGHYATSVTVQREWAPPGLSTISCVDWPCAIEVKATADPSLRASTPISFFAGRITVSPNTVSDGQVISVTGYGWGAGGSVELAQCALDVPANDVPCTPSTFLTADQNGNFFIQGYVYRYPGLRDGQHPDCRAWAGRCSMVARSAGDPGYGTAVVEPLTFL